MKTSERSVNVGTAFFPGSSEEPCTTPVMLLHLELFCSSFFVEQEIHAKKRHPPPNRGLNPLHKSRLQSKQTLLEWGEQNRQHVIPVCWLFGFEATGFGWRGLPRLAGQLVHTRPGFTDPHHMMWTLGVNNGLRCILRGTKLVLNS